MIKRWANSTAAILSDAKGYTPGTLEYDKLHYGTYVFFSWLVNSILILAIAVMCNIFFHVLVMYLVYGCLRRVSYGVHLDKAWHCTVISAACYLLGIVFAHKVVLPLPVTIGFLVAGLVSFWKYAPAETKKRPLSAAQKKRLKPLAISIYTSMAILCVGTNRIPVASNLILSAILIQSFNITPMSYKLFTRSED